MRLAIVTNILTPYRNPVFADLADRPDVDLLVLTYSEAQAHRQWNLSELYAQKSFNCERISRTGKAFPAWHYLRTFNPDVVVIGGYDSAAYLQALLYAKAFRKPAVLWSGSTERSVRRQGFAGWWRRRFIRNSNGWIAYGTMADEFLRHHGADPDRIVIGYNTVDIGYFSSKAEGFRSSAQYRQLRERFAPFAILFVGQLIERKGFNYLMAALGQVKDALGSVVVLGDGPLRDRYEKEARQRGWRIFFEGFCNAAELPLYYAACDVLVFPTINDPWGLVVNEAMACGLPIISSPEAGATWDLVKNGCNGFVVDPRDTAKLAEAISKLAADRELRARMSQASKEMIQQFTPHNLGNAIVAAATMARN